MPYTTILIDDEKLALSRLERLLKKYPETFEIIGAALNGKQGLEMVESLEPDLIFLDIEMPAMNGFEMLSKLKYQPMVVFATAFEEYAIKAFEENSIDYLLKPIENSRLEKTIEKLQSHNISSPKLYNHKIYDLLENLKPKKELSSITVKIGDRILLIRLEEITYFEAKDKYVYLYTIDGKKHLIDHSLSNLEEMLPTKFIRVSRSLIVNTLHILEIQKYFNSKLVFLLKDTAQSKLISGTSYYSQLKSHFGF